MTTAIKDTVRAFIVDSFLMGGDQAGFTDSDSFLEQHIVDSTGFLELIMFLEETYGIEVKEDEMVPDNLDSLDAIDAYVQRKKAA